MVEGAKFIVEGSFVIPDEITPAAKNYQKLVVCSAQSRLRWFVDSGCPIGKLVVDIHSRKKLVVCFKKVVLSSDEQCRVLQIGWLDSFEGKS